MSRWPFWWFAHPTAFFDTLSFKLWQWHLRRLLRVAPEWFVYSRTLDIYDEMRRSFPTRSAGETADLMRRGFDNAIKHTTGRTDG